MTKAAVSPPGGQKSAGTGCGKGEGDARRRWRRRTFFAAGILLAAYASLWGLSEEIGGIILAGGGVRRVELARSPQQWRQGLAGRVAPAMPGGMLFLLRERDRPVFWMRGMRFPLDLIWLRGGEVVAIDAGVPVPEAGMGLREYTPPSEVDAIWEAPAGTSDSLGLRPGARIHFLNFRHRVD